MQPVACHVQHPPPACLQKQNLVRPVQVPNHCAASRAPHTAPSACQHALTGSFVRPSLSQEQHLQVRAPIGSPCSRSLDNQGPVSTSPVDVAQHMSAAASSFSATVGVSDRAEHCAASQVSTCSTCTPDLAGFWWWGGGGGGGKAGRGWGAQKEQQQVVHLEVC